MELYPFEIVNYLLEKTALDSYDKQKLQIYPKTIDFKFLDCRKSKGTSMLPFSIELPENAHKSNEALMAFIGEICQTLQNSHICIIKTNNFDKEEQAFVENVLIALRSYHKNFVSIALGGHQVIENKYIIDSLIGNIEGNGTKKSKHSTHEEKKSYIF